MQRCRIFGPTYLCRALVRRAVRFMRTRQTDARCREQRDARRGRFSEPEATSAPRRSRTVAPRAAGMQVVPACHGAPPPDAYDRLEASWPAELAMKRRGELRWRCIWDGLPIARPRTAHAPAPQRARGCCRRKRRCSSPADAPSPDGSALPLSPTSSRQWLRSREMRSISPPVGLNRTVCGLRWLAFFERASRATP